MDMEELNAIATLLHITSEIATNHPDLKAIQKACLQRLGEINQELADADAEQAVADAKAVADEAAKNYKAPEDGSDEQATPPKAQPKLTASDAARRP